VEHRAEGEVHGLLVRQRRERLGEPLSRCGFTGRWAQQPNRAHRPGRLLQGGRADGHVVGGAVETCEVGHGPSTAELVDARGEDLDVARRGDAKTVHDVTGAAAGRGDGPRELELLGHDEVR
jgi:hypothetical protein